MDKKYSTVTINDHDLKRQLKELSAKTGIKQCKIVEFALREYIEKHQ